MTEETAQTNTPVKAPVLYDAEAEQRFPYEVSDDGKKYDTAHIYKPLSDPRYLAWVNEFKIKVNQDKVTEETREASIRLWDDLIKEVENIEYDDGAEWKSFIDPDEKITSLNDFLAVAIFEDDEKATGKRKLGAEIDTQTVVTEAFFNGEITRQTHVLKKKSDEWQKKYNRIQDKQFKQETTRGLRRKPKIEFIPQHEALGSLYDEMFVSQTGFKSSVPLRFKIVVIEHIFASHLDKKK